MSIRDRRNEVGYMESQYAWGTDAEVLRELQTNGIEPYGKLDAYGHLSYAAGNEDWQACADFVVIEDPDKGWRIAYHVVVNCESGGFIDTLEAGFADSPEELNGMLDYWAGLAYEQYTEEDEEKYGSITHNNYAWEAALRRAWNAKEEVEA